MTDPRETRYILYEYRSGTLVRLRGGMRVDGHFHSLTTPKATFEEAYDLTNLLFLNKRVVPNQIVITEYKGYSSRIVHIADGYSDAEAPTLP